MNATAIGQLFEQRRRIEGLLIAAGYDITDAGVNLKEGIVEIVYETSAGERYQIQIRDLEA